MFLELIATFIAGIGAAGLALLLNHATGGRLPRWITPVAAGLTMIGYTIWSEYSWAERTIAELPEGVTVVEQVSDTRIWKPWTYVFPQVVRLVALDATTIQTNPNAADTRLVELYFFGRWQPPAKVPQLVQCQTHARADVSDAALADAQSANWLSLTPEDALIRATCDTPL